MLALLEKLHDLPSNPNVRTITPLHLAARYGYRKAVWALIAAGANVNAVDTGSFTPLLTAVAHRYL